MRKAQNQHGGDGSIGFRYMGNFPAGDQVSNKGVDGSGCVDDSPLKNLDKFLARLRLLVEEVHDNDEFNVTGNSRLWYYPTLLPPPF